MEELLGEIVRMNKKKIILIHRNLGVFDYYFPIALTNQHYDYHFYIFDLDNWYQLISSKEISKIIKEFKVNIYFHMGSLRSTNLKIDNRILLFLIKNIIIKLRLNVHRNLRSILNFLFIGTSLIGSKIIKCKEFENYDILFQWSKLDSIGKNLLTKLKSINKKITLVPDAVYSDISYTWPISDMTNDMNIRFNVTHENNKEYLVKNFNISPNSIKLVPNCIKNKQLKSKFEKLSNSLKEKNSKKIVYFSQKNFNSSNDEQLDYISIIEHKKNLKSIFNYLSIYRHKSNFIFYLKLHPKKYILDSKWLKNLSKEFKIKIVIVKETTVWPLILKSDLIFNEFSSSFILSTIKNNTFLIQNKSFEYYFHNSAQVNDVYKNFMETEINSIENFSEKLDYYFLNSL